MTYVDIKDLDLSIKLLKLYYQLLSSDCDIKKIEKLLKIKVSDDGITDLKGNKINKIVL